MFFDYSQGARRMGGTVVRDMLTMAQVPGLVNFGGGLPAPELFPMDAVRAASEAVLERQGWRALQYSATEGHAPLREALAERTPGLTRDHVQIVNGGQQALDLIAKVLVDPGDLVLVEAPTYMGALSSFAPYGPAYRGLPMDEDGLDVGALESVLGELAQGGRRAKFLYVVPNFQNPTGRTLSLERRERLLDLSEEHGLVIVEDDPYAELRFSGAALPSVYALALARAGGDPEAVRVVHFSSFSKVLAPGLREGWVQGAREFTDRLAQAKQGADMHSPTFNQMLVHALLPELPAQVERLRVAYARRAGSMLAALEQHLPPGVAFTRPAGGMFLWLTLPGHLSASALLPSAVQRKVGYLPGEHFFHDASGANTLRLCFTNAPEERIGEGVRALAGVLAEGGERHAAS